MAALLRFVLASALGSFVVSLLTSLGISVAGYYFLYDYVDQAFIQLKLLYTGLPASVLSVLSIAGVPEAMSILGSAYMTVALFAGARVFFVRSSFVS